MVPFLMGGVTWREAVMLLLSSFRCHLLGAGGGVAGVGGVQVMDPHLDVGGGAGAAVFLGRWRPWPA